MKDTDKRTMLIFSLCGFIPVIWAALKIAPYTDENVLDIMTKMDMIFSDPYHLKLTENSLRVVLIFVAAYVMGIGIYYSTRRNYRRGEEHGSASWGDAAAVNKRYVQKPPEANKILTQHVRIGLDGTKHRRNLNVLVIGGSGAGKTRFYCKPNLMQANTSFVVLDPNGKIVLL